LSATPCDSRRGLIEIVGRVKGIPHSPWLIAARALQAGGGAVHVKALSAHGC